MSQTAENALLHVEDEPIPLWYSANEDANDVNTNEMIDFLERKGKNPPLPLKPSNFFRNWYAPPRYDPEQKYNMDQYNPFYVQRAKLAWKLYKNHQAQIQGHKGEEDRASRAEIYKDRYNEIKDAILQRIRNYDPMNPLYPDQEKDLKMSLDDLKYQDKADLTTELDKVVVNKTTPKNKMPWLYMFSRPKISTPKGGKRVTRIKRSKRVKRSTKRRKH